MTGLETGGLSPVGFVLGGSAAPAAGSVPTVAGGPAAVMLGELIAEPLEDVAPDLIAACSAFSSFSSSSRLFRSISVLISDGIGGTLGKVSFGLSFMNAFIKPL